MTALQSSKDLFVFSSFTQFFFFSPEERTATKRRSQLFGFSVEFPPAEESLLRSVPFTFAPLLPNVCLFLQVITALRFPCVCFSSPLCLTAVGLDGRLSGRSHTSTFFLGSRTEQNWTKLIPVSHCASPLCCSVCLSFFPPFILSVSLHYPRGCFSARVLARYVSCQPWSRFLLRCLLDSGESCLLHPATLRLITLVRGGRGGSI